MGFVHRAAAPLGEAMRRRHRRAIVRSYLSPAARKGRAWIGQRTESDNFYYDLSEHNLADLAHSLAVISGAPVALVRDYLAEVTADDDLHLHLQSMLTGDPATRDSRAALGRRVGWYAAVRLIRPRLVVETGVHHGVGACVLSRALWRNESEGHPGRYLGTDIDPRAGRLFTGSYRDRGDIAIGDSLETLRSLSTPIDIFINDSDHSADYEASEYEAVAGLLSADSLIIGDNSHATSALRDFAERENRPYLFFAEKPIDHWYPGAGIGMSPARIPLGVPSIP